MDSVKELLERDCGGANPLMKLTSHFTKGSLQKRIASNSHVEHNEFVGEFLSEDPRSNMAPNTFSMDALLHEMDFIQSVSNSKTYQTVPSSNLHTSADCWVNQFNAENIPFAPLAPGASLECEWTQEFLHGGALDEKNLLAREYLELIDSQQQSQTQEPDGSMTWLKQLEENDALADAARDLLVTVSDPKLEGTQFMQFMKQLSDGSAKVKDNEVIVKNDVVLAQKHDLWSEEFLGSTSLSDKSAQKHDAWSDEFLASTSVSHESWVDDFNEKTSDDNCYSQPDVLADSWVEEFTKESTLAGNNQLEAPQEDFWDILQKHWGELAREDPNGLNWLSDFDKFDADSYYKDYTFHENNGLLDHPDPFVAGKEKLDSGDIPGAVLLFEAAVQKNLQNAEAWLYLGTTLADNEQEPEAIAALRKCLEVEPNNLTALLSLAVSYTNESLMQRACETLHDWLRHNPQYGHLVTTRRESNTTRGPHVSSFMSSDYHNTVKDLFLKAVGTRSEVDADIQIALGVLFNLSSEYDKAVDCFTTALQLRPNDSLLWNKLGATLANATRSEEAVDAYRQALSLSPGYIRTRYNLGVACVNLGAHREAMGHFLSALELQRSASSNMALGSSRSVMSDNLWSGVDTTLTLMGRSDLQSAVNTRDLSSLLVTFSHNSQQDAHVVQDSSQQVASE